MEKINVPTTNYSFTMNWIIKYLLKRWLFADFRKAFAESFVETLEDFRPMLRKRLIEKLAGPSPPYQETQDCVDKTFQVVRRLHPQGVVQNNQGDCFDAQSLMGIVEEGEWVRCQYTQGRILYVKPFLQPINP